MELLSRLHRALRRLEVFATVALMLGAVFVILLQVADTRLSRLFADYHSHPWTQELALLFFVWTTFLGATLGVESRAHFGIDFLVRLLPGQGQRLARGLAYLCMIVVLCVFIVFGAKLVVDGMNQTFSTLSFLGRRLPRAVAYLAIPVSGLLMARYLAIQIARDLRGDGAEKQS